MDHREGVEPSPSAWKADILAVKLPVDTQDTWVVISYYLKIAVWCLIFVYTLYQDF